jgi:hypothetical protein
METEHHHDPDMAIAAAAFKLAAIRCSHSARKRPPTGHSMHGAHQVTLAN